MIRLAVVLLLPLLMAACKSAAEPPVTRVSQADSADQVLFGVRVVLHNNGLNRALLLADTAMMFEDNTRTELRTVSTTFYTPEGAKNATLTARQGTYNVRLGTMEARGDVVVLGEDGRKLTTPQLRYDPQRNEISSDSSFRLEEPGGWASGTGFIADPNLDNIRIHRDAKGTRGSVTLPGKP